MKVFKDIKYDTIISGGYGLYNFGDDALMYMFYKRYEYLFENEKFIFLCEKSNYLGKLVPKAKVFARTNTVNLSCNNFVLGGGTLFYSFSSTTSKPTFFNKLYRFIKDPFLGSKKLLIKFGILKVKYEPNSYLKILNLGIGLGPFNNGNDERKKYAVDFCKKSIWVSVRDKVSYDFLRENDIQKKYLGTDICFLSGFIKYPNHKASNVKNIGIIVRDWDNNENSIYQQSILENLFLLRKEYKVTFIVFSSFSDKKWIKALDDINEEYIVWNPNKHSIDDFLKLLNDFDLFLTARYHGFVFASLLNIPSVCIGIEQKLDIAHEQFKNSSELWCNPFSINELLMKIRRIDRNYREYQGNLKLEIDIKNQAANEMFNEFDKNLSI